MSGFNVSPGPGHYGDLKPIDVFAWLVFAAILVGVVLYGVVRLVAGWLGL